MKFASLHNRYLLPIIFVIVVSFEISPQEKTDSLYFNTPGQPSLELQKKLDEIDFLLELKSMDTQIMFNEEQHTIWQWTNYSLKQSTADGLSNELPEFISLPLYRKYNEDSKFNPVRFVLGMAQLGATGYLAYKSIKKYGFFKN